MCSSAISSDCHRTTKNLKVHNRNPLDKVLRRVITANTSRAPNQTERVPPTQAQFKVGIVGTSHPLHYVLITDIGTDGTSKAVANGHANHRPRSRAGTQTNGTPKGQTTGRVNGK